MNNQFRPAFTEMSENGVTLQWEPFEGAQSYRVLWSDRDTREAQYQPLPPTEQTSFRFTRAAHVPYWLRVQALDGQGSVLAESAAIRTPVRRLARPQLEELGRGLVAVCTGDGGSCAAR